jgi:hypothetical protein
MPKSNEEQIFEALQAQGTRGEFIPRGPRVVLDPVKKVIYQPGHEDIVKSNPTGSLQAAAAVQVADISAVDIAILLQEVIGAEMPFFNLRGVCRQITMNELKLTVPLYTKMGAANQKVPELQEADIKVGDFTNIVFALWKNVSHIIISDEAKKRANIDVFAYQKTDCAIGLARSENQQIADELHGSDITQASGHAWDTMGTYHSNYNPYDDLQAVQTTLSQNGFTGPYDLVCNPEAWAGFWANTYVKGFLGGQMNPDYTKSGGFPIPGFPGVTGWSDPWVTDDEAYFLQRDKSIILGVGPTEAAAYRNEIAGYDAYILRQWLQPLIAHPQASRQLTGIHG